MFQFMPIAIAAYDKARVSDCVEGWLVEASATCLTITEQSCIMYRTNATGALLVPAPRAALFMRSTHELHELLEVDVPVAVCVRRLDHRRHLPPERHVVADMPECPKQLRLLTMSDRSFLSVLVS